MPDAASTIRVNGEEKPLDAPTALTDVLRRLGIDPSDARGVAVALNDEVVRRTAWSEAMVTPGDRLEVITATQGG